MEEEEVQNNGILAFSYSSSDNKATGTIRADEYGELPYSEIELRSIRRWVKSGKFFYGALAAESAFKSAIATGSIEASADSDWALMHLGWLYNEWSNVDPKSREPKIPDNLNSLNGTLKDFANIFEIDKDTIAVASQNSLTISSGKKDAHADGIHLLSTIETQCMPHCGQCQMNKLVQSWMT